MSLEHERTSKGRDQKVIWATRHRQALTMRETGLRNPAFPMALSIAIATAI